MDTGATTGLAAVLVYVVAAGVALARMIGVMTVLPAFTRLGLTGLLQGVVALVLSLPLLPPIAEALSQRPATLPFIGLLLLKEAAVGVLIGLVVGAPLWAAQVAGDLLDIQLGASSGLLSDPSAVEASAIGTLLSLAMLALYYGSGAFLLTIGAVYDSYALWPVDRFAPLLDRNAGQQILRLLDHVVAAGLMLAAPLIACLLLTDLVFGAIGRAAPQLHAYFLSQNAKSLLFVVLILMYSGFLVGYLRRNLGALADAAAHLRALAGQAAP
jgi:type III secretion protein T